MSLISLLQNISKYRAELMGYAILGVMVAHIKTICGFSDTLPSIALGIFCYSIFTGGFIFLSGLGLYYSLQKNPDVKLFYLKRIKRLLIPYWIISLPYFVFTDLYTKSDILGFLAHISTIDFWIKGNFSGMWYIAFSLLLYVVYPAIHRLLYRSKHDSISNLLGCGCVILICIFSIHTINPIYYEKVSLIWDKFILFLLGSYTMYIISTSTDNRKKIFQFLIGGGMLLIINSLCMHNMWSVINSVSILLVAYMLSIVQGRFDTISKALHWLGKYSLELYIIHLLVYYFLNDVDTNAEDLHIIIGVAIALAMCVPVHSVIGKMIDYFSELKGNECNQEKNEYTNNRQKQLHR